MSHGRASSVQWPIDAVLQSRADEPWTRVHRSRWCKSRAAGSDHRDDEQLGTEDDACGVQRSTVHIQVDRTIELTKNLEVGTEDGKELSELKMMKNSELRMRGKVVARILRL